MIDYSRWEEKQLPFKPLLLDPKNPRIPPSARALGQRELIAELVEHDRVYELAKDIVSDGWSPLERMIVHENEADTLTYVLEGNRRLCALKLLSDPELAPVAWRRRFKTTSQSVGNSIPKKVPVLVAPSREAAARLIMQKHTRTQVQEWDPLMQARYYRSLAENGLTAEQIAQKYGGSASEIADMLRINELYALACRLDLPSDVAEIVRNPRAFKSTHLERLMKFSAARKLLGVEFIDDGRVRGKGSMDRFVHAYSKIVSDIATGEIHSRSINKAEDAEKYVKDLLQKAPSGGSDGTFDLDDVLKPNAKAMATRPPKLVRTVKAKPKQNTVIPKAFKCRVADRRTNKVFDELRRLKVHGFENSAAVMLRVLLELAVDRYMHKTGAHAQLVKKVRERNSTKKADWSPSLDQMLNELVTDPAYRSHPNALKMLNKMVREQHPQLADLHAFVHNSYSAPSADQLISYWEIFEPIFEVVLSEPTTAPASPTAKRAG